jgi:hypothetical protein
VLAMLVVGSCFVLVIMVVIVIVASVLGQRRKS